MTEPNELGGGRLRQEGSVRLAKYVVIKMLNE